MAQAMRLAIAAVVLLLGACMSNQTLPPSAVTSPAASIVPWPSPLTPVEIRDEIERRATGRFIDLGLGAGVVSVTLRAPEAALAQEIVDAYGPAVEVSVGLFPFPLRDDGTRSCAIGRSFGDHPSLRATLDLPIPPVSAGDSFQATVRIQNISTQPFDLETGADFEVFVFRRGSLTPIGDGGGTHLVGRELTLLAANATTMPGNGGTSSCDASLGYTLPAGPYEARALVEFSSHETGLTVFFWSEPSRIDILAR
jgi:hypothetical protein